MENGLRVVVAIPTFRRPSGLARSLPPVIAQIDELNRTVADVTVSLLIVDNDPEGSARSVVASFGSAVQRYVVEKKPGIASARNRALDEGRNADVVVFIDDDEHPRADWLGSLVRTWRSTTATAVMGRVVSVFDVDPEPWVVAGDFFRRRSMATGTEIEVAAAGNLLLDLTQLRRMGVRFDERLGTGGGEDTLLSLDIKRAGGTIVWCEESVATDRVPAERLTREWLESRFLHHGNTAVVVELLHSRRRWRRSLVRCRALVGGAARRILAVLLGARGAVTGSLADQARAVAMSRRGAGMMAAAIGRVHREYDR